MTIAPELEKDFEELNEDQKKVIAHDSGPMMVIAGPGSGKTRCLVLRAMNLLLLERAKPQELVLCTYTKKAAFEMQDRLSVIAKKVGYRKDISQMHIGTIHSICERIIAENVHRISAFEYRIPLPGNQYKTLDELAQRLFIFENLEKICERCMPLFMKAWTTKWNVVKQFEDVVKNIKAQKFTVEIPPHPRICEKCDLRSRCTREGIIGY